MQYYKVKLNHKFNLEFAFVIIFLIHIGGDYYIITFSIWIRPSHGQWPSYPFRALISAIFSWRPAGELGLAHSCHVTSILVSDWCRDNHIERVLACHSLGVDVNVVSQDGFLSGLTVAAHNNCIQVRGSLHIMVTWDGVEVVIINNGQNEDKLLLASNILWALPAVVGVVWNCSYAIF